MEWALYLQKACCYEDTLSLCSGRDVSVSWHCCLGLSAAAFPPGSVPGPEEPLITSEGRPLIGGQGHAEVCHGWLGSEVQFMNKVKNASTWSAFLVCEWQVKQEAKESNYKVNEKCIFRKNIVFPTIAYCAYRPLPLCLALCHAQSRNFISNGIKLLAVSWVSCAI